MARLHPILSVLRTVLGFLLRGRLGRALTVVALLVLFGPRLIALTPLPRVILTRALTSVDGALDVGSVSLGWFTRIGVSDLTLRDRDGTTLVHIPRLQGSRTLLGLLFNRSDLGTLRAEKATVHLAFAGMSSNLEQALAKLLTPDPNQPKAPDTGPSLQAKIELVDARVHVRDEDTQQEWTLHPLNLVLQLDQELKLSLDVNVASGRERGALTAHLSMSLSGPAQGEVKAKLETLPLALATPLLRRLEPGQLAGRVDGHATFTWKQPAAGPLQTSLSAELRGTDVDLKHPLFGSDRLRLAQLKVPCKITTQGSRLIIEQAELTSELASGSIKGAFDFSQSLIVGLSEPGNQLKLDLDLARLARQLPDTIHLHPDLKLEYGRLRLDSQSERHAGGLAWKGRLASTELRATRAGQSIVWPNPIQVDFALKQSGAGLPEIQRLTCQSGFLRLDGTGSADRVSIQADLDLANLAQPLSQFVDLGAVKLAGQAGVNLTLEHKKDNTYDLASTASLRQFQLSLGAGKSWQEAALQARLSATMQTAAQGALAMQQGSLTVTSGPDELTLNLLEPVPDLSKLSGGAGQLKIDGDFARWQNRLAVFTSALDAWRLGGVGLIQGNWKVASDTIDLDQLTIHARDFRCQGPGLNVLEPTLEVQTAGRLRLARPALELEDTRVRCTALGLHAPKLLADFSGKTPILQGSAAFQGDLARLRQWIQDPKSPAGTPMTGAILGNVELQSSGDRLAFAGSLSVKDLVVGPPGNPTYRDPLAKLVAQGRLDWTQEKVQLDKLKVEGQYVTGEATGSLSQFAGAQVLDLQGRLSYDLEKMERLLRPYLGIGAKASGKDARAFKLAGPLVPKGNQPGATLTVASLQGDAGFSWQSLKAFGCDAGPAEVATRLDKGWLRLLPLQTSFNGGRLRLEAQLRIEPEPMELHLSPGQAIERAKITPEMCASALGYALPALANVAQAEGAVSLSLEKGRLPLSDFAKGEVKGTFVLHNAKVAGGGLLRELGALTRAPLTYGIIKEANVPFHMVDGRVHHKDLELVFPDFAVKTSGSVGFDGSLALVAEMPIPPRWIGNQKVSAALAKQTVRIPLRGTVSQPRLDEPALRAASAQFARDAAAELLRQQIDNRLPELFRPKKN